MFHKFSILIHWILPLTTDIHIDYIDCQLPNILIWSFFALHKRRCITIFASEFYKRLLSFLFIVFKNRLLFRFLDIVNVCNFSHMCDNVFYISETVFVSPKFSFQRLQHSFKKLLTELS